VPEGQVKAKLSKAQQAILKRLIEKGGTYTFDGTRHKSFVALAAHGLIIWTYKVVPSATGRHSLWHLVTLTQDGWKLTQ
jgi:hypothetical protein